MQSTIKNEKGKIKKGKRVNPPGWTEKARYTILILSILSLFMCGSLAAQVKIKERVELKSSKQKNENLSPINGAYYKHKLKLIVSDWSSSYDQSVIVMSLGGPGDCPDDSLHCRYDFGGGTQGQGSITWEIDDAKEGSYDGVLRFSCFYSDDFISLTFDAYFDEYLIKSIHFSNRQINGSDPWGWSCPWIYTDEISCNFLNGIKINLGSKEICSQSINNMTFRMIGFSDDRGHFIWQPVTDTIVLKITKGAEYADFYDMKEEKVIGDEISYLNLWSDNKPDEDVDKYCVMTGEYNGNEKTPIIIETSIKGVLQNLDTLWLMPPPNHYTIETYLGGSKIEHEKEISEYIWYKGDNNCWKPLSDTSGIYARLIYGMKYCSLRDENTGIKGDDSIKLQVDWGSSYISLIADGEEPAGIDSVIIRFTSSDPRVTPLDLTIYIEPAKVRVTLIPGNISPGDTADIKLEKWNEETNQYDLFSPEQIFDIGVVGGCDYGNILYNNTLQSGFTSINGTVKFVADSTISPDSVASTIMVSLPDEGGGVADVSRKPDTGNTENKINAEVKSLSKESSIDNTGNNKSADKSTSSTSKLKNDLEQRLKNVPETIRNKILQSLEKQVNKQAKQKQTNQVMSCAAVEETENTGKATEPIVKSDCKEWEAKVIMKIYDHNSGTNVYLGEYEYDLYGTKMPGRVIIDDFSSEIKRICESFKIKNPPDVKEGFFLPLYLVPFCDFQLNSCKESSNRYHFKVPTEIFQFKVVKDICSCNVDDNKLFKDITDIDKIPFAELPIVLIDLQSLFIYASSHSYNIENAIMLHENKHMQDFIDDITQALNSKNEKCPILNGVLFKNIFSKYTLPNNDLTQAKSDFWTMLYYLKEKIKENFDDRADKNDYEQSTQNTDSVQNEIQRYIDKVNERITRGK